MRHYSATVVGKISDAEKLIQELGGTIFAKSEEGRTVSFRADDDVIHHVQLLPCIQTCQPE